MPIRVLIQRFAFLFLILAAITLMLLSKAETSAVETVSSVVVDIFSPVMDALSQPAAAVSDAVNAVRELANIHEENERLRRENARLLAWQEASRRLAAQNQALMALLDYKPDPRARYIAARVIGDSGGAFVRSVLVNVGSRDGLTKGQAAMTGHGLAGRVTAVGHRSGRILLITDINSRVPVLVQSSRDRAILAGDNSGTPRLAFLPSNATVNSGDIIVTSGHGGIFPAGLPVGRASRSDDGKVRVNPFVQFEKMEFVRIIDYENVPPGASENSGSDAAVLE
jgi:rod shape-determining protein MreC